MIDVVTARKLESLRIRRRKGWAYATLVPERAKVVRPLRHESASLGRALVTRGHEVRRVTRRTRPGVGAPQKLSLAFYCPIEYSDNVRHDSHLRSWPRDLERSGA